MRTERDVRDDRKRMPLGARPLGLSKGEDDSLVVVSAPSSNSNSDR